jgi:hypothetical protein
MTWCATLQLGSSAKLLQQSALALDAFAHLQAFFIIFFALTVSTALPTPSMLLKSGKT